MVTQGHGDDVTRASRSIGYQSQGHAAVNGIAFGKYFGGLPPQLANEKWMKATACATTAPREAR